MTTILQLFVFFLIILSFAMIITIPIILATSGEWEKSQNVIWKGSALWAFLVILIGIFNIVPASAV